MDCLDKTICLGIFPKSIVFFLSFLQMKYLFYTNPKFCMVHQSKIQQLVRYEYTLSDIIKDIYYIITDLSKFIFNILSEFVAKSFSFHYNESQILSLKKQILIKVKFKIIVET